MTGADALAVFAGGFTMEAARAVVGPDVEYLIERLVASGEVVQSATGRCELRRTVRGTPDEATRDRHLRWARAYAEQHASDFDALAVEHANFEAALGWGVARADCEPALALAAALGRYWEVRGHVAAGRRWLTTALRANPSAAPAVRANALNSAGLLAFRSGDYPAARTIYEESLALHWDLEDRLGATGALHALGNIAFQQRDWDEAATVFEESLNIGRQLHDDRVIAASLTNLGAVAEVQGDYASARPRYEEALELWRTVHDDYNAAAVLTNLADVAVAEGNLAEARSFAVEALEARRRVGDKHGAAAALVRLATIADRQGDAEATRRFVAERRRLLGETSSGAGPPGSWWSRIRRRRSQ